MDNVCQKLLEEGNISATDIRSFAHLMIDKYPDSLTIHQISPKTITSSMKTSKIHLSENSDIFHNQNLFEMLKETNHGNLITEAQELLKEAKTIDHDRTNTDQNNRVLSESLGLKGLQIVEALVESHKKKQDQERKKHANLVDIAKKIEVLINPTASLPADRKAELREKLSTLEKHLIRAKEQVDSYKLNCRLMADLATKQPQLMTKDCLQALFDTKSRNSTLGSTTIQSLRVIRALEQSQIPAKSGPEPPSIDPTGNGGTIHPDASRLNTRSILHSYLNRTPAITRHIGCSGNDLARLLRLVS